MDKQKLSVINSCIAGIKKRDENSVNMLYDLIASVIGYIAYKYLKDVDAEDLIQDFWASIYDLADKFILMTNGYGYLCKTMNRMAINRRKKLYGDNVKTIHYVDYSRLKYSDDNRSIEEINFKMNVEKAMEKLDDTERLIMQLKSFGNNEVEKGLIPYCKKISIKKYPNDMERSAGKAPRVLNIRHKRKRKGFVDVKAMTIIFFRRLKKFGYNLLTKTSLCTIV